MILRVLFFVYIIGNYNFSFGLDSLSRESLRDSSTVDADIYKLSPKKLILPSGLIAAGAVSFAVPAMKKWDLGIRQEVAEHNLSRTVLDDYTQYVPGVMVYGLNLFGVKGRHDLGARTIIYASSQLIAAAIVTPAKSWIGEERPDGSNRKSFPSGHAATAFSNAHFMYREYRHSNTLLSLAGYPFAVFTGVYRVVNNKHWMTDIVAGAGVGILSTELAYWIYPKVSTLFHKKKGNRQSMLMPYYQSQKVGLSYQMIF
ncbi:phosphatase PAP2 family protein [Sphingobacterium tabacisoli]|uniref:Phosphatase PAP2 family protein n=1 Tax=Sphingobacterium tabacisoli TaxID=2044855 RepID=A0ABW5KZ34_9SPHI|nr:phosphatase PAP2 family protein [Sphingobacterium tabacisoli]